MATAGVPRRKSAHGRLQSSTSAALANTSSEGKEAAQGELVRSRRVKSAREPQQGCRSSVLPPFGRDASTWGRTQYEDDFGRKQPLTPVPVRPTSPTRMNNPHPAMPFLQWKQPVRIHSHKKSLQPTKEAWQYINEGFYDDYTDTRNTGDAKNEVPVTNVAKIEFPGKKMNDTTVSTPHLMSGVSGTKAQLNSRTIVHKSSPGLIIRPPSAKSRMMHNTVKGNTLPALREWLKTASNKERDIVLQMLTAAHPNSEDVRLKKAIDDVLQPDSAVRVQQWLQSATSSEKKTLLGVLETLAVASQDHVLCPLVLATYNNPQHYRSYSYPVSLRPRVCHRHKSHKHKHAHGSHSGCYSRHSHNHHHEHHHHSSHKPHCHKAHKSSSHKDLRDQDMTLIGKRVGVKRVETPELWHHKVNPPEELRVLHPGSVFQQPHKDRGRHYAIHPEWPTA